MEKGEKNLKTAGGYLYWDQNELIDEKTLNQKSREAVPLKLWKFINHKKASFAEG